MMIRDVLMVLLAMALFVFALQPRDHAHGQRRREGDSVSGVQANRVPGQWQLYETQVRLDLHTTRTTP
ncbi:MAG: hypothetical protein JRG70_17605 [Deltaproteobacteria bacterium]|nr:hypothetical protein [Deltaproteobacteria bacterium]